MIKPKLLWQGSISEKKIFVKVIDQLKSNRLIDPVMESKLQQDWIEEIRKAKERGSILYDGRSYRLEDFKFLAGELFIEVSTIMFSTRSPLKKRTELEELGEGYYSKGLSIGGFVETTDGSFVFAVKSDSVVSNTPRDIIGGVVEIIDPISGEGLLNMNRIELKEEINVDKLMINMMKVIGLIRSSSTDIIICTHTKIGLSDSEVNSLFAKKINPELKEIEFVSSHNLNS